MPTIPGHGKNQQQILECLTEGNRTSTQIATATGLSLRGVSASMARLRAGKFVRDSGDRADHRAILWEITEAGCNKLPSPPAVPVGGLDKP
ncbi:MarR family winged helix-turn-helix transcriptional regulator [Nocardia wallacei]|uniref:MarR family winged helix-turn-helix transcriptional regulator n=1 Tax=Nocardia wallacei TaxID=480035 RepID=UPI00245697DE|nr:MarR family winged helix-turn-helix transcriptional regulator [Nocardia wallacei]